MDLGEWKDLVLHGYVARDEGQGFSGHGEVLKLHEGNAELGSERLDNLTLTGDAHLHQDGAQALLRLPGLPAQPAF